MPAKTQLKDLLNGYGQETEVEETPVLPNISVDETQNDEKVPPSRRGKRHISGYFDAEVYRQVKIICAEDEKTVQQVLGEALNALFINRGKPPIA
ncbi:MAG: hypothetical protein OXU27_13630 [Candidatus Poribacteria bacterium]|nr:hypothetical protein [Candidatus Poribacteria bacterium]